MLVKNVMHVPVLTIQSDATLRQAAERMVEYGVNGLPVLDAGGYVVGIIGLKDILRAHFRVSPKRACPVRRALTNCCGTQRLRASSA